MTAEAGKPGEAGEERTIVVERSIAAAPATVFALFTTTEAWLSWQGTEGEIEARPGGLFRVNVRGDGFVSGRFVEVTAPRRLVFTWGWEPGDDGGDAPYPVPPGGSTVEVELEPDGNGTRLRLTHRIRGVDLEPLVEQGWTHYLARLATRAEGRDPGPDPAAV